MATYQQRSSSSQNSRRGSSSASSNTVRISKSLSWILRHGAQKEGLPIDDGMLNGNFVVLPYPRQDGYIDVDVVLGHRNFRGVSLEVIRSVVENNDKKRFTLVFNDETMKWKIKANQGHTLKVDALELQPLSDSDIKTNYANIIHGTNLKSWDSIKSSGGLSRMARNHIHLSPGEPGDEKVVSGMRASSNVWVYVDAIAATNDGFQFFLSPNNVILTPGDKGGFLPLKYLQKVVLKRKGFDDQSLFP